MRFRLFTYIALLALALSCSHDGLEVSDPLQLSFSVNPFDGEIQSKANLEGTGFKDGDLIKIKVICPYVGASQVGEYTSGASNDSYWLMKYSGGAWGSVESKDGFDINGSQTPSGGPTLVGRYLSQNTPYVFTASTWSEENAFVISNARRLHYCHVFHADQRNEAHYLANDLLWGQNYMQTASWNVHLQFSHVMSALQITLNVPPTIAQNAILTLEGMPDIDMKEVVIGNYYADKDKNSNEYGPKYSTSCSKENNGKVLGVSVIDENAKRVKILSMSGSPAPGGVNSSVRGSVPDTGRYIAYHDSVNGVYRMIVPPCVLTAAPVFYLVNGDKKYRMDYSQTTFEQGCLYPVTLKIAQ